MRTIKSLAFGLGAVLLLVTVPTSFAVADRANPQLAGADAKAQLGIATAAVTDCGRRSAANSSGQEIFLSTATPKTYLNEAGKWQNVDCTSTTFRLAYNQRALVVADFNAESDCNGTDPTNGQWCQTRALLNGIEGAPSALEPSSFAFDSVAGGVSNWEANSMNRAWEVRCVVQTGCQYRFAVQARLHDASVTSFWLDEIAAHLHVTYGNPAAL